MASAPYPVAERREPPSGADEYAPVTVPQGFGAHHRNGYAQRTPVRRINVGRHDVVCSARAFNMRRNPLHGPPLARCACLRHLQAVNDRAHQRTPFVQSSRRSAARSRRNSICSMRRRVRASNADWSSRRCRHAHSTASRSPRPSPQRGQAYVRNHRSTAASICVMLWGVDMRSVWRSVIVQDGCELFGHAVGPSAFTIDGHSISSLRCRRRVYTRGVCAGSTVPAVDFADEIDIPYGTVGFSTRNIRRRTTFVSTSAGTVTAACRVQPDTTQRAHQCAIVRHLTVRQCRCPQILRASRSTWAIRFRPGRRNLCDRRGNRASSPS